MEISNDGAEYIKSLHSLILDLPPSCIDFSSSYPNHFVVGTYSLETESQETDHDESSEPTKIEQRRSGSLVLFKIEGDKIHQLQTIAHPSAVLDLQFSPHEKDLLVVAGSNGALSIYLLVHSKSIYLEECFILDLFPTSALILSVRWHPKKAQSVGLTLSTGEVQLHDVHPSGGPTPQVQNLSSHGLEAWTLAFSPDEKPALGENTKDEESYRYIYSGGDDAAVLYSRTIDSSHQAPTAQQPLRKMHDAGVTALLPLPSFTPENAQILVTGSYDDHIRVIDVLGRKVLSKKNLGGGVWRLKLMSHSTSIPTSSGQQSPTTFLVLASCMHAGVRVVEISYSPDSSTWSVAVLAKFEEHKSMNYASVFQPVGQTEGEGPKCFTCVSTSFYDRLLCLWRFSKESEQTSQ
ncbi:MAG: hypothetical protein M1833_002333 [Piccolia ochrophora]|nr:MAG: hypothetical protein M1833_002333 [Piccolia ochrophora]